MEHLEIKITECRNGFIIEKHQWKDETCGDLKEYWITNEGGSAAEIVRQIIPYENTKG